MILTKYISYLHAVITSFVPFARFGKLTVQTRRQPMWNSSKNSPEGQHDWSLTGRVWDGVTGKSRDCIQITD